MRGVLIRLPRKKSELKPGRRDREGRELMKWCGRHKERYRSDGEKVLVHPSLSTSMAERDQLSQLAAPL